jgi:hypothetical protein
VIVGQGGLQTTSAVGLSPSPYGGGGAAYFVTTPVSSGGKPEISHFHFFLSFALYSWPTFSPNKTSSFVICPMCARISTCGSKVVELRYREVRRILSLPVEGVGQAR